MYIYIIIYPIKHPQPPVFPHRVSSSELGTSPPCSVSPQQTTRRLRVSAAKA